MSASYRVRLMVEKTTGGFSSWILRMPLFYPVQVLFQFYMRMTGRKDARTLQKPVKCQASNSPFVGYDLWTLEGITWTSYG